MIQVKFQAQRCLGKSIKFIFVLVLSLVSARSGTAQFRYVRTSAQRARSFYKRLYVLAELGTVGVPYNYQFEQKGNVLKRGWLESGQSAGCGNGFTTGLALHYRYSKLVAFEVGVHIQDLFLEVHDLHFMNTHGVAGSTAPSSVNPPKADLGNFAYGNSYATYYAACYYFFPSKKRSSLYLSSGLAFSDSFDSNNYNASYYYATSDENLNMTVRYKPFYFHSFLESGIQVVPSPYRHPGRGGPVYFIGLRYNLAGKVIFGDYQDTQPGAGSYVDHVTSNGSYLSFSIKIGGAIWSRPVNTSGHLKSKKKSKPNQQLPLQHDRTKRDSFQF